MELTERADGVLVDQRRVQRQSRSRCAPRCRRWPRSPGRARGPILRRAGPDGRARAGRARPSTTRSAGWRRELGLSRVIAVGGAARPIQHGAALEGSWHGEAGWVPDVDAAIAALRAELRPGDVVLVKASRAASLERVALAIAEDRRERTGRRRRHVGMKTILIAAVVSLVTSILCTPLVVAYFRRRGFGQEIRVDGPQTHLVKRGTPTMGGVAIVGSTVVGLRRSPTSSMAVSGGGRARRVRTAVAVPDGRPRRRRLPRRLHQDPQAAQPRPARAGEVRRPAHRRRGRSRSWRSSSATSSG